MPPKQKFKREEILDTAFEIARRHGLDAVKARDVGDALGCSPRPIFTCFIGMEDLQKCIVQKAWLFFGEYLSAADEYVPAFKMRGMRLVRFAQEEPHLFRILFMNDGEEMPFSEMMRHRIGSFASDIAFIEVNYHISYDDAERLFNTLWLQVYGICSMIVNNRCTFTEEQVSGFLGACFAGQILLLRSGSGGAAGAVPVKKDSKEAEKFIKEKPYA